MQTVFESDQTCWQINKIFICGSDSFFLSALPERFEKNHEKKKVGPPIKVFAAEAVDHTFKNYIKITLNTIVGQRMD